MLQADGGTLARSRNHSFFPSPISDAGSICTVSKAAAGVQRTAVFAFFPFLSHGCIWLQKVSSNSPWTHTELSCRERSPYERQVSLDTGRHTCTCCPQQQRDINYQIQFSFPKLWTGPPGQMRASLGQWKEDAGLLMCNEAEPKNLPKTKEKQPGQWGTWDAALNLLTTTMGTKFVQGPDMSGIPLAESQFSLQFSKIPNHRALNRCQRRASRNISLFSGSVVSSLCYGPGHRGDAQDCLSHDGGLWASSWTLRSHLSRLGVACAPSTGLWEGTQKGPGASGWGLTFLQHIW